MTNYGSRGVARSKPDPQDWENKSTLFKLGYNFNDKKPYRLDLRRFTHRPHDD